MSVAEFEQYFGDFVNVLPYKQRIEFVRKLIIVRSSMAEQITLHSSFQKYLSAVNFIRTNLRLLNYVLLNKVREKLLALMENCTDQPSLLAVAAICLIATETHSLINFDQLEIHIPSFQERLKRVEENIIEKTMCALNAMSTNVLLLSGWTVAALIFSYREGAIFFTSMGFPIDHHLDVIAKQLMNNSSVPKLLCSFLSMQNSGDPFRSVGQLSVHDQVYICAISGGYRGHFKLIPKRKCGFEDYEDEPPQKVSKETIDALRSCVSFTTDELERNLSEPSDALSVISQLEALINTSHDRSHFEMRKIVLRHAAKLMKTYEPKFFKEQELTDTYGHLCSACIELFLRALDKKNDAILPLAPFWLGILSDIRYELMTCERFLKVLNLAAHLLINVQAIYRDLIASSPQWYFNILSDLTVGVIDHLEINLYTKAMKHNELDDEMCKAVLSLGRVLLALRADDPDIKNEFTRLWRQPLSVILARLASANAADLRRLRVRRPSVLVEHTREDHIPAVRLVVKRTLAENLLNHMTKLSDKWALGQLRISLKPPGALDLLDDLILENFPDGASIPQPARAVSGVDISRKLSRIK